MQIDIAAPCIGDDEKKAVIDVLSSGQLIQGPKVAEFERAFADYHGARFGIATSSGTTALIAAMMAHGIGPGDEVIVPSFSFFATASSILCVGATPVFADIDPDTFCLSPLSAEAAITRRTKAIMPVHLFGMPAEMARFEAICRDRKLTLLEDAAQAHGAALGPRRVGTWGTAAFSFYPTKNMTTGEGGMVLTNDEQIARTVRMVGNQGRSAPYTHEIAGYNFRMTEVAAAMGIVQLRRLSEWTIKRIDNASHFNRRIERLHVPAIEPHRTHVFHQYTSRVRAGADRDLLVRRLRAQGIDARVYYAVPIHRQPAFQSKPEYRDLRLPATERAATEVLSLPVHPGVTDDQRDYVVREVNAALASVNEDATRSVGSVRS